MKKLHSNSEWEKWGEIDPLFGVASWKDKQRDGPTPWTDDDFFKLGESDWKDFALHWERYGVDKDSCLEIGCGAGRITKQLASTFVQTHAIDVSQSMLDYAQQRIDDASIAFYLSTGTDIPMPDNSVSSVFSVHVFQHFDSIDVADLYMKEIIRVLRPTGTMMIHLPILKWPPNSGLIKLCYEYQKQLGNLRAKTKRFLMNFGLVKPPMRELSYPIEHFYRELPRLGLEDIEVSIFATSSNGDPHSFIFARKGQVQSPGSEIARGDVLTASF